jgi:hypothetical protein
MHAFRPYPPALLLVLCLAPLAFAQEAQDPARLIPNSAILYLEISQPEKVLDLATDQRLWEVLKRSEGVQKYLQSEDYRKLLQGVELFEARLGVTWEAGLRDVAGGRICVAFDPLAQAGMLIVQARHAERLKKLNETLLELAETDAKNNGRESPVKSREYNGVTAWSLNNNAFHTILGDMLVACNKQEGIKFAIDQYQGGGKNTLAQAPELSAARKAQAAEASQLAYGFVRLAPLRLLPNVSSKLDRKHENPPAELLLGGVLDALKEAPVLNLAWHEQGRELKFRASIPLDRAQISEKRRWFFADEAGQSAYAPLRVPGTIATITAYRNISGMWLARDELFDEATVANLSQADSQLGLFFAGRDFGSEVLGELTPRTQFIVVRQEFSDHQPIPAVKLPAFALVLEMKDPEKFATPLLVGYQSLVGITNIVGLQNGQPQLLMATEDYAGVTISKATYITPPDAAKDGAKINYNFSPSCARVGNRFVLASTTGLARKLIDELKKSPARELTPESIRLDIDLAEVAAALADNREAIVAQNMLAQGQSREQAAADLDLGLELLRTMRSAIWRLTDENGTLALEIAMGLPK